MDEKNEAGQIAVSSCSEWPLLALLDRSTSPKLAGQTGAADVTKKKLRIYPPDIDLNQPRGPIKTCIEETTLYDRTLRTQISEYAPDGKMISSRWERDGKVEHSTSDNQARKFAMSRAGSLSTSLYTPARLIRKPTTAMMRLGAC